MIKRIGDVHYELLVVVVDEQDAFDLMKKIAKKIPKTLKKSKYGIDVYVNNSMERFVRVECKRLKDLPIMKKIIHQLTIRAF